jgi:hypothetical protein
MVVMSTVRFSASAASTSTPERYASEMYGTVYGTMARMVKTTVYLPPELMARVKRVASERDEPEAEIIRNALEDYTLRHAPRPRHLIFDGTGFPPDLAERDEDYLAEGFGRD